MTNQSEGPAVEKAIGFTNTDGAVWDVDVALWVDDVCQEARHATEADLLAAGYVPAAALEAARAELATDREGRRHLEEAAKLLRRLVEPGSMRCPNAAHKWIARDQALSAPTAESGKDSSRCPSCGSPDPKLHPAVQHEGECRICSDPWHNIEPAPVAEAEGRVTSKDALRALDSAQGISGAADAMLRDFIDQREREAVELRKELEEAQSLLVLSESQLAEARTKLSEAERELAETEAQVTHLRFCAEYAQHFVNIISQVGRAPNERERREASRDLLQRFLSRVEPALSCTPLPRDLAREAEAKAAVAEFVEAAQEPTGGEPAKPAQQADQKPRRPLAFRGSVTDLATDVAFELTPEQTAELIQELERFRKSEPAKFRKADDVYGAEKPAQAEQTENQHAAWANPYWEDPPSAKKESSDASTIGSDSDIRNGRGRAESDVHPEAHAGGISARPADEPQRAAEVGSGAATLQQEEVANPAGERVDFSHHQLNENAFCIRCDRFDPAYPCPGKPADPAQPQPHGDGVTRAELVQMFRHIGNELPGYGYGRVSELLERLSFAEGTEP